MKKFDNLLSIDNYIPNCLVCQKPMMWSLVTAQDDHSKRMWLDTTYRLNRDGYILKNIKTKSLEADSIIVDIQNNEIKGPSNALQNITVLSFIKKCSTCRFTITFSQNNYSKTKNSKLPPIYLNIISLDYMMPQNKSISITIYSDNSMFLAFNGKRIGTKYILKLEEIQNIRKLNRKIGALLTFS